MKHRILSHLYYALGHVWSYFMCWTGFGYRFYSWAMNKSVEYDIDCRLWKPAPEYKMARYRTTTFGKKRKKKKRSK